MEDLKMALTAKIVRQLNNMNAAAQRAQLGTLLSGGAGIPESGSLSVVSTLKYSLAPALASITAVHAAILLVQTVTQTITTGITNPDFPRTITVDGNDANVTGNVVIAGTNILDEAITETIALSGTATVAGVKAFKTVTSIVVPAYAVAGTETVSIGTGAKVGFPVIIDNTANVLSKDFDGSVDAGTTTASTTVEGSIYASAGTFDGAKILELTFIVVG